jgi:hypothetical protein
MSGTNPTRTHVAVFNALGPAIESFRSLESATYNMKSTWRHGDFYLAKAREATRFENSVERTISHSVGQLESFEPGSPRAISVNIVILKIRRGILTYAAEAEAAKQSELHCRKFPLWACGRNKKLLRGRAIIRRDKKHSKMRVQRESGKKGVIVDELSIQGFLRWCFSVNQGLPGNRSSTIIPSNVSQ